MTPDPSDYRKVTDGDAVSVPEWASEIDVGDTIAWETKSRSGEATVVGFSTTDEWQGHPAVALEVVVPEDHDPAPDKTAIVREHEFSGIVEEAEN